jgi:hypothetical protein
MQTNYHNKASLKRGKNYMSGYLAQIKILAILLLTGVSILSASGRQPLQTNSDFPFQIAIHSGNEIYNLNGEAEIMVTPSSYSIQMIEDKGRCVIHMLNFTTPPGPGIYKVGDDTTVKTAMVCLVEGAEPQERLVSHSGTFTITELNDLHISGHFNMILKGPISGKDFHFSGKVKADVVPMHLPFTQ